MIAPPRGTVTFLFTDIEGSTRLWDEYPAEMQIAAERHDSIVRQAIESRGGYVFSTAGDGFAAAFDRVGDALAAAIDTQRSLSAEAWPAPVVIRVRTGLHTGEAQERDGDYFGRDANRAARIMSAGHGGQVLASSATAALLADADASLRMVGEVELAGLARPETVFQVMAEGLVADFPPPRSLRGALGNIPLPRDSLLGREHELAELQELLKAHRAVTLTGLGGVGKTRLALAAARRAPDEFPDGVWLVELAEILDGGLVAQAVASTLGIRPQVDLSVLESVVQVLEPQHLLLVLDNCEHVLDDAAALVDAILARAPDLVVLATSREGIGIAGERLVAVRPLGADGADSPAVQLFVDRATEGGWVPAADELDHVVELCQQLDGVPLAIELAAARARSMPADEMVTRLGDRLRLLTGRRRSIERHQTLRATVGWSYDLLTGDERSLFDRLSVFTGSFDLAAAERVCAGSDFAATEVDDLLGALVDKSLVTASGGRYAVLETLRQFGEERLAATDDPDRFRDAHVAHYQRFATDARVGLWGPDQGRWWARLDASWANVRGAFRRSVETGDTDRAITIPARLGVVAYWHEHLEPLQWAAEAMLLPDAAEHRLYATCVGLAAFGAGVQGDMARAQELSERARAARGDPASDPNQYALFPVVQRDLFQGRTDQAIKLLRVMAEEAAAAGQAAQQAVWQAQAATLQRFGDEALASVRDAIRIADATGNPSARSWVRWSEGLLLAEPHPASALRILEDALAIAEAADITFMIMTCQRTLAEAHSRLGHHHEALRLALQSVRTAQRQGAWAWVWNRLIYVALALDGLGDTEGAARLVGCVSGSPVSRAVGLRRLAEGLRDRLTGELGSSVSDELIEEGRWLSVHQAVELAEQRAAPHLTGPGAAPG